MAAGLSAGTIGLIGAGASVLGGVLGAKSAGDAADAQGAAAAEANRTQRYMYDTTRADQAPYRELGYSALDKLRQRMGLTVNNFSAPGAPSPASGQRPGGVFGAAMSGIPAASAGASASGAGAVPWTNNALMSADDLMNEDPSYQFRRSQGEQGINRSAAAGSGQLSGATLRALARYNQDFASTEFQNSFNRLSSLAGVGQNATNAVGAAGQNYANNVSNNQLAAGNARAAGYVGQANAFNNALGQGFNMYQNNQMMDYLKNRNNNTGLSSGSSDPWSSGTFYGMRSPVSLD
jgi:hypothetical protein